MISLRLSIFVVLLLGAIALLLNSLADVFIYGDVGVFLFMGIFALVVMAPIVGVTLLLFGLPRRRVSTSFDDEEPTVPYAARDVVVFEDRVSMPSAHHRHALTRSTLLSLVVAALVVAGAGCSNGCGGAPKPGEVVKHTVVDCLEENQEQLAAAAHEMILKIPNWSSIKDDALSQGTNLAFCAAAKVITAYLAPAGGRSAPEHEDSEQARAVLEAVRERASSDGARAVFRTELGDL